jgi:purine-binding chemotaxis protein CheW
MKRDLDVSGAAVARIVRDRGGVRFALPAHTTLEIVDHPQAVRVPGARPYALGLLAWQGERIALIDFAVKLGAAARRTQPPRYALVVAYQSAPGAPMGHGAIALDTLPDSVMVDDDAACALPESRTWRDIAIACFEQDGLPVPVVDTAALMSAAA